MKDKIIAAIEQREREMFGTTERLTPEFRAALADDIPPIVVQFYATTAAAALIGNSKEPLPLATKLREIEPEK